MEGPNKSHFVCAVIWRRNDATGEVEFLVLDSVSTDAQGLKSKKQIKFPGGMNRVPQETPTLTLQREVLEETHLALIPERTRQIWEHPASQDHTKYGFLVPWSECRGTLRTEVLRDNGDEMSAPYWVPALELGRSLFEKHQAPYLSACREIGIL